MSDDSDLPLRKRAPWESLDDEDKPKKKARQEDSESGSYDPSGASGSDYEHMELGSEEFASQEELDIEAYQQWKEAQEAEDDCAPKSKVDLDEFDTFLFDIDGVIWKSDGVIKGSVETLNHLANLGKHIIFWTNNTQYSSEQYANQFNELGINVSADNVLTPAAGIANYLTANHPDIKKVYLIGSPSIKDQLSQAGIATLHRKDIKIHHFTEMNQFGDIEIDPEVGAVVLAYDCAFDYVAATHGLVYLMKTNILIASSDTSSVTLGKYKCPIDGAFLAYFQRAHPSVEPVIIGKTSPLHVEMAMKKLNMDKNRTLVIGDDLKSELKMAQTMGMKSALVLSGVNQRCDIEASGVEPTYVAENIKSLLS